MVSFDDRAIDDLMSAVGRETELSDNELTYQDEPFLFWLANDLRSGLARALGLDPAMPFDRVLATLAAADRERAAEARAVDDALGRRLREDQLLRTVGQIERLVKAR